MKKLFLFAAALLILAGCNESKKNVPAHTVTITGGIEMKSQGPSKVAARDGWETASTVDFLWEKGDEIAVIGNNSSKCHKFTVSTISQDGKTATFTGEPLSGGMGSYKVVYPYGLGEAEFQGNDKFSEWLKHQQYTGKLNPMGEGTGSEESFTIVSFLSVLDLSLTGEVVLGKIEYYVGTECQAAISMGDGGLQLTNEPQHVTLSVFNSSANGFKLKFYDTNNQFLMEKETTTDITTCGKIYSFPEFEVKAAPTIDPKLVFTNMARTTMVINDEDDNHSFRLTFVYYTNSEAFEFVNIDQPSIHKNELSIIKNEGNKFTIKIGPTDVLTYDADVTPATLTMKHSNNANSSLESFSIYAEIAEVLIEENIAWYINFIPYSN